MDFLNFIPDCHQNTYFATNLMEHFKKTNIPFQQSKLIKPSLSESVKLCMQMGSDIKKIINILILHGFSPRIDLINAFLR